MPAGRVRFTRDRRNWPRIIGAVALDRQEIDGPQACNASIDELGADGGPRNAAE